MKNIAGLVLAGGQSSRMGEDKATLASGEQRLIDHIVSSLTPLCDAGVWVGGRDYGYPWYSDSKSLQGPMAAILKLGKFSEKKFAAFIILPVDMPYFSKESGALLLDTLTRDSSVEAAFFEQSHFPLILRNVESVRSALTDWLEKRTSDSVLSFLQTLKVKKLILKNLNAKILVSLNYPEDYLQYVKTLEIKKRPFYEINS